MPKLDVNNFDHRLIFNAIKRCLSEEHDFRAPPDYFDDKTVFVSLRDSESFEYEIFENEKTPIKGFDVKKMGYTQLWKGTVKLC